MKKRKQPSIGSHSEYDAHSEFDNALIENVILNRKSAFKIIRPSLASTINHPSVKNNIMVFKPREFKLEKRFKLNFYRNDEDNYGISEKIWLVVEILKYYRQKKYSVKEEFSLKQIIANSYYKLITDLQPKEIFNITNCEKGYHGASKYYPLWAKVSFTFGLDPELNTENFPCLKKFLGDLYHNINAPSKFKYNFELVNQVYEDIQKDNHATVLLTCTASMAKIIQKLPESEKYDAISLANRCVALYDNPRCLNTNGVFKAFFDKYLPSKHVVANTF